MSEQRPYVGMGILVTRGEQVLLGQRRGSHGAGDYAAPGGHLEYGESFETAVRREVREETGDHQSAFIGGRQLPVHACGGRAPLRGCGFRLRGAHG
jgi:ADP-ribose pyrophosphatase YjhB (NUDIX family)